jgi:hypothetical protein
MSNEEISWELYMLGFHTQQLRDLFHCCTDVDIEVDYYDVLLCSTILRNDSIAS